jgi:hypothetical protein
MGGVGGWVPLRAVTASAPILATAASCDIISCKVGTDTKMTPRPKKNVKKKFPRSAQKGGGGPDFFDLGPPKG